MVATMEIEQKVPDTVAPLGSLLGVSLENYEWAKDIVSNNKHLGPHVGPLIDFTEETTRNVLKKSPVHVEDIVSAVDNRVGKAVNYGTETVKTVREASGKLKNRTLTSIHDKLQDFKYEKDEVDEDLVGVSTIAQDTKMITTERLNALLDASEGYLAQYLPISDDDKSDLKVESPRGEIKPIVARAGRQSKVAAKRFQEQALAKVSGLKKRTSEVVHVDLVKYSEFLDKQKKGAKETVYFALEKIDEKVLQPTKNIASDSKDAVNNRVVNPVKNGANYVILPFQDGFIRVWTVVGDQFDRRVVQPRTKMVAMLREELEQQKAILKLDSKLSNDEELTLVAALPAFAAAFRERAYMEWKQRVAPWVFGDSEETFEEEEKSSAEEDVKSFAEEEDGTSEDISEGLPEYAEEVDYARTTEEEYHPVASDASE